MIRKVGIAAILFSLTAQAAYAAEAAAPAEAPDMAAARARMEQDEKTAPIDVDRSKLPPARAADMIAAIRQGDCDQVKKMLKDGLSPNQFDSFGYTPLTVAAIDKQEACVYFLLEGGADVNLASAAGWTPLIGAAMSGGSGILIEMLLNYGADINARNQWGCTPLYYAAGFGALGTVDYLLLRGAQYPGTTGDCMTPLKIAQMRQYPEVIKRLEKAEAEAQAKPTGEAAAKAADKTAPAK